jgi:hypothetical protein
LDKYAGEITEACIAAANASIPFTGQSVGHATCHSRLGVIPGWAEYVEPTRAKSILWHDIWIQCGRPKKMDV